MPIFDLTKRKIFSYLVKRNTDAALLLTGEWGCGKTFYVESIKEEIERENIVIYYSLNGVDNVSDVVNTVSFEIICSETTKKDLISKSKETTLKIVNFLKRFDKTKIYFEVGDLVSHVSINLIVKQKLKKCKKQLFIIFDDLERISDKIDITDLLGNIHNNFTLNGVKVLYIADDTKLKDIEKFNKEKEKYILRTITFAIDKDALFVSFLQKAEIVTDDFVLVLHQVFDESQVNLRTVKFCIDCYLDLHRYYKTLSESEYNSPDSLFYSICRIGKFYRQGNSNKEELQKLMTNYFHISYLNKKENEITDYDKFAYEYGSKIVRQSFILDLIYDGVFTENEVKFYLRKPKNTTDPLYSLVNIKNMETFELIQKLNEICNNLKNKMYSYKDYAVLKDSFIPNVLKLKLDTEQNIYKLLIASIFAEDNIQELTDTFGYWQIDSLSKLKTSSNEFEKLVLSRYDAYCKKEKEKNVENFYQSLKNCDRSIIANTSLYNTIYSDLISLGYIDKIFELPNKSIRYFSYFIDNAICHLIEAYICYTRELPSLKCFIKKSRVVLRTIDKNDILKIEAIQDLQKNIELAIQHIENKD